MVGRVQRDDALLVRYTAAMQREVLIVMITFSAFQVAQVFGMLHAGTEDRG